MRACARCVCLVSSGPKGPGLSLFLFRPGRFSLFPWRLTDRIKEKREERRQKREEREKRGEERGERRKEKGEGREKRGERRETRHKTQDTRDKKQEKSQHGLNK